MEAIDSFQNKLMFEKSQWNYVKSRDYILQRYLDENVNLDDHEIEWEFYEKHPLLGKAIIDDYIKSNNEKVEKVIDDMLKKSLIVMVIGTRGSGKTCFSFWLAEKLYKKGKKIFFLNVASEIPEQFGLIEDINDAEPNSVIVVDEAALEINARRSTSTKNVDVMKLLTISRHQDISLIFISQHSSFTDVSVRRMADAFIFKKLTWDEAQAKQERTIDILLQFVKRMLPKKPSESLYFDGENWFSIDTPLPSFWNERISKPFSKLTFDEAIDYAVYLSKRGKKIKEILSMIKLRTPNTSNLREPDINDWLKHPELIKKNHKMAQKILNS